MLAILQAGSSEYFCSQVQIRIIVNGESPAKPMLIKYLTRDLASVVNYLSYVKSTFK